MWAFLVAFCLWHVRAANLHGSSLPRKGSHDLTRDSRGKLVFTQLKSKTRRTRTTAGTGLTELYSVNVNLDIESMQSKNGVSMMFDKTAHVMRLDSGLSPVDGIAWGSYDDTINTNGWSTLFLETTANNDVSNDVRSYAAGYIEGLLTCVRLSEYYYNYHKLVIRTEMGKHAMKNVKQLFKDQIAFMKLKANLVPHIMAEEPEDSYWKHSRYMLFQLWGMTDGYNYASNHFGTNKLALEDMLVLNSAAEMPALVAAYTPKAVEDRGAHVALQALSFLQKNSLRGRKEEAPTRYGAKNSRVVSAVSQNSKRVNASTENGTENLLDDAHWERTIAETGHCSALIHVTSKSEDVYVGHTTWDDYSKMTRIFKYYTFPYDGADVMATKIGFSSYPGAISSTDDFYVMSSGLTIMDTSIAMLNPFIWDKVQVFAVTPYIPNFIHLMAVNRMARNGMEWTRMMASQNTGTYNSQWMVVDYNRFTSGKPVPDDMFWVLEAVPGSTWSEDMSHVLRDNGYWPSYNRPYFNTIRQASGHTAAQRAQGAIYSWLNNPRAKIFRGAQSNLDQLVSMRTLMTRNLYPFTGVFPVEPGHEISARMDLSSTMPIPNGGIDAKIVSRCSFAAMQVQAISSPAHGAVPAFQWTNDDGSEKWIGYPHVGLPNKWNFDWVQMTPTGLSNLNDIITC